MATIDSLLPLLLAGFGLAGVIALTHQFWGRALSWLVALLPLTIFAVLAMQLPVVAKSPQLVSYAWVPSLNVSASLYLDGLSLLMGLIVSGVGTLIMIYAGGYLAGDGRIGRFYVIILIFMSAMLGVVLSDNIIFLFIFWELTSISSYLLIGFNFETKKSRNAARQALLVTGSGGLALMAGLILLGFISGSWQLSQIVTQGDVIRAHPLYGAALTLVLLGAFTKSAQFPFHFWLPNAMAAPTPVSAYLHSATMVKAGVYLLARLLPALGGTAAWFGWVTAVGVATALLGAWLSWQQTDLKRILAYSTVSALGTLVMLLGMGSSIAVKAAMLFLLVHSLYKGGLFMAAGAIDHETGTRDIGRLGGMARLMPFTMVGVLLAALSMAGLPPLLGFISKELMYEATLALAGWGWLLTGLTLAVNVFMVAAAAIVLLIPFFGAVTPQTAKPHHAAPLSMWLGPVLLGLVALGAGLFSESTLVKKWLMTPAVTAVYGGAVEVKFGLWHGLTPMLLLSVVTVTLGLVLYWLNGRLRPVATGWVTAVSRVGPEVAFERGLDGLLRFAGWVTALIQNGYLRFYLLFVMLTGLVLVGLTFVRRHGYEPFDHQITPRWYEIAIALVIILGAVSVVVARSRLFAVASLGVVGYGIALLYILYSAPDLAMTQFSIETLTVILFVLVLFRLPRFETISKPWDRVRDFVVASLVGGMMSLLVLSAKATEMEPALSNYFAKNSYGEANGRNVVNVILVDFRGADTMVEITVLAVAALGVYGLIKSSQRDDASEGDAPAELGD